MILPIIDSLNLESQNQAKNIPVVISSFPIKIWGKLVMGFLSYDQTYVQIDNKKATFLTVLILFSVYPQIYLGFFCYAFCPFDCH